MILTGEKYDECYKNLQKQTIKTINNIHSVEELTQNLDEIWNF